MRRRLTRWSGAAATALLLTAMLLPLYWTVVASVTPESRLFDAPPLLPLNPTLQNYRALFTQHDFWLPLRNSLVVAGATTLVCVSLGAFAAYALARLRFRGRRAILAFTLAVAMFPQISIVSPLYMLLRTLGLIDTYPGLVLPYLTFAMPLTVWLLVGYFRQMPPQLVEAARVDGASHARAFREVVLPIAVPGLATTAILTFLFCWNEFLFALSFTLGPERWTVPVAIALFRGQYQVPWGEILAGAIVATLPIGALVLAFQRRIVRGMTTGAVKG